MILNRLSNNTDVQKLRSPDRSEHHISNEIACQNSLKNSVHQHQHREILQKNTTTECMKCEFYANHQAIEVTVPGGQTFTIWTF